MPHPSSIITLLTDFGTKDHFVASMKGVILNINPQARIIDLSHDVTPYDVQEASNLLKACYRYYPEGTIHVAVVDPGVGSSRRPLLVTTCRYFFIAPDNGLLSPIYEEESEVEVRQITARFFRLKAEGSTFDGRDLFAPAAAWLTLGHQAGSYGEIIRDFVRVPLPVARANKSSIAGQIVQIDRFGNLISNITAQQIRDYRKGKSRSSISVRIASVMIEGLASSYNDGSRDEPHALINSNGQLEIFIKEGNAAESLRAGRGERVEIS
jgi:hypothetical protein